jgi:hypothetical protein
LILVALVVAAPTAWRLGRRGLGFLLGAIAVLPAITLARQVPVWALVALAAAPNRQRPGWYWQVGQRLQTERGPAVERRCAGCAAPAVCWSYDGTDPDERTDPARGYRHPGSEAISLRSAEEGLGDGVLARGGRRGRWRVGLRRRLRRRIDELDRVDRDPPPAHTPRVGAVEHEVDVPDRGRRQRAAGVRTAPVVALVITRRPMVGPARSRAVVTAPPELGVERVERLGAYGAGLRLAEERSDVFLQVPGVHPVRRPADVERLQIPVEQLVERRARARAPLLVDLV